MALIDYVFSGLVAFGTIFLASVTYLSIHESKRKEEKADRLAILSERIRELYVPLLMELYKARSGKADANSIYRIAYINYILAEEGTRKAIDVMVSHFAKINPNKPTETQAMISIDYQTLESSVRSEYEKLIREFYYERGLSVPEKFTIPDIVDAAKRT